MTVVFCPNPACPRGVIPGPGRDALQVRKCPDCGRTSRLERTAGDGQCTATAVASYRRFRVDCSEAVWSGPRR